MGSYMIYKDLCSFTKTPLKNEVEHLINPAYVVTINENIELSLALISRTKLLNKHSEDDRGLIYPFIDDASTLYN